MNLLLIIINYIKSFFSFTKENIYQHLLERPRKYFFGKETINSIDLNNDLVKTIDLFCIENNVYQNGALISLSGGVDSMVVISILIRLSLIHSFPIYACSIDYNNREEQTMEIEFLKKFCKYYNVQFYVSEVEGFTRKKNNSGSRTEYEEESRKVRFDLYQKIISETNCTGVFVGHHKDDIIENIFTNSMKGGNLLDLEVMGKISKIHNVHIFRPLLDYHKNSIYELGHKHEIPYFLDTTPKWSRRGKMRNEIFPLLDNVFSPSWRIKLKDLGDQSNHWGQYINEYIIDPWFKTVKIGKYGFIMEFKNEPKLIYSNVLLKVMHSMGRHMLKNTSIDKIINNHNIYDKQIILDSGMVMYINSLNPNQFIVFHKNEIQEQINNSKDSYSLKSIDDPIIDFINGKIIFNQLKNNMPITLNKRRYTEMKFCLPFELVKIFSYHMN